MAKLQGATGTVRDSLAAERHEMGIHGESQAIIMSMLSNLYADPIMAVLREYAVNALDATIDAGSSEPIHVTLPAWGAPTLSIQDYGIGLTTQEVVELFGLYGNSTKRNSDSVTGMLGVGCKSGLTYANSYSVVSVRNGVKTVANVNKNEVGVGELAIVDTVSTDERNGTRIDIPVHTRDIDTFREKAKTLFSFWQKGTVLVDGRTPVSFDAGESWVKIGSADVWVGPQYTEQIVVMGSVPYRVDSDIVRGLLGVHGMVAFVNMGEVHFAPSREELMYDNQTKKCLSGLMKFVEESAQNAVNDALAKAQSLPEAYEIRCEYENVNLFSEHATWVWNGEEIPTRPTRLGSASRSVDYYKAATQTEWEQSGRAYGDPHLLYKQNYVIVDNFTYKSVPGWVKKGVANLIGEQIPEKSDHQMSVVFYSGSLDDNGYKHLPRVDWADIKNDVPKPKPKKKGDGVSIDRTSHNFEIVTIDENPRWNRNTSILRYSGQYITDIDTKNVRIIPVLPSEDGKEWAEHFQKAKSCDNEYRFVAVYKRSMEAFCDEYDTYSLADVRKDYDARVARISAADLESAAVLSAMPSWVEALALFDKEILDSDVVDLLNLFRDNKKKADFINRLPYNVRQAAEAKNKTRRQVAERTKKQVEKIASRYAVLSKIGRYSYYGDSTTWKDTAEAMNAIYTYRKDNK